MFDIFRNGKVHVMAEQCKTCIFHPGNKMHLDPGRLQQMVHDSVRDDTCIVCHDTLDGNNAVCRGFYDRYETTPLQIAKRMGVIEEQPINHESERT